MISLSSSAADVARFLLDDVDCRVLAAQHALTLADADSGVDADVRAKAAAALRELCDCRQMLATAVQRIYFPSGPAISSGGSSFERLDDDVLAEIFCWTAGSNDLTDRNVPIMHPAFVIASVCRRWRTIALRTSILWAKVRVIFQPETDPTLPQYLSTILDRCRGTALDVVLISTPGEEWTSSSAISTAVARLFERSRRISLSWGDIVVRFSRSLLPLLLSNMPLLEEFAAVQHPHDPATYCVRDSPAVLSCLNLCASLRVLDLGFIPIDQIDIWSLPLIEVFRTRSTASVSQLCEMCRAWGRLEELSIYGVCPFTTSTTDGVDPAIVFSTLRTLACYNDGDSILGVFARRHLPSVTDLSMEVRSSRVAVDFLEFIGPWQLHHLNSLTLTGHNIPLLLKCFSGLPDLAELRLLGLHSRDLRTFIESWKGLDFLSYPLHLQCLRLVSCGFGGGVVESLLTFLSYRNDDALSTGDPISALVVEQDPGDAMGNEAFPVWMLPQVRKIVGNVSFVDLAGQGMRRLL